MLAGYNRRNRTVLVADPYAPHPFGPRLEYWVNIDRVIGAILLGIVTYDANLLVVSPQADQVIHGDPDRRQRSPATGRCRFPASRWSPPAPTSPTRHTARAGRSRCFNLCRSYRYQSLGYYVSLLAAARGHRPLPSVTTIQDLKSQIVVRLVIGRLDELIQRTLAPLQSDKFTLTIYFGRNLAKRYEPWPSSCSTCSRRRCCAPISTHEGEWQLRRMRPIAASDIPPPHHDFVVQAATAYFAGRQRPRAQTRHAALRPGHPARPRGRAPFECQGPAKFEKAAEAVGLDVEFITRDDYGRLAEFDALFIRETTVVNHHTYRFARRAAAEGLVVIDDPDSILKCTNKVYLAELLTRHDLPHAAER